MKEITFNELLEKCPNVMIGKAGCPCCKEAFELFSKHNRCFCYCPSEVHMSLVEEARKHSNNYQKFPMIYMNKEFIGGADELRKKLEK